MEKQEQNTYNYVLIIKYECGESGYLTNQPDLILALDEYNNKRMAQLQGQHKNFPVPMIREAKLYKVFR